MEREPRPGKAGRSRAVAAPTSWTSRKRRGAGDKFERNSVNVFPEDADEFAQAVSEMASKLE